MDFGAYLLHTKILTMGEYQLLLAWQNNLFELFRPVGDQDEFVAKHLKDQTDLSAVRAKPLGPILAKSKSGERVLQRSGKTVEKLVEEWQEWHCHNMEPIATYPLTSKFGPAIYERQLEKRLVATFVVSNPVDNGGTLIRDGDNVAIPEGTSALYVGLAIAAKRKTYASLPPMAVYLGSIVTIPPLPAHSRNSSWLVASPTSIATIDAPSTAALPVKILRSSSPG